MKLRAAKFNEIHARKICDWKYDGEYCIYNYPKWEKMCDEKWGITIEDSRKSEFKAVIDENDCLCGYIRLVNKYEYIIIGIGLKPALGTLK